MGLEIEHASSEEAALTGALTQLTGLLRAERAMVAVQAPTPEGMTIRCAFGLDPARVWTSEGVSLHLLQRVLESGDPLLLCDAMEDPEFKDRSSVVLSQLRSVLCIRFKLADDSPGLLYADHRMETSAFRQSDLGRALALTARLERRLLQLAGKPVPEAPEPVQEDTVKVSLEAMARADAAAHLAAPAATPPTAPATALAPSLPPRRKKAQAARPDTHRPPVTSRRRPRAHSVARFFRSMSVMFAAGISFHRALEILAKSEEDPAMAACCRKVDDAILEGRSFSSAMTASGAFAPFHLRMVEVGERTGSLGSVLERLADYEEKAQALSARIRSTLAYPAFLLLCCTLLLVVAPAFLMGGIFKFIQDSGITPPLLTRLVLALSGLARGPAFWVGVSLLAGAFWLLCRFVAATPKLQAEVLRQLCRVPRLGTCLRTIAVARFARALAIQVEAGAPLLGAVQLSGQTDPLLYGGVGRTLEALRAGAGLTRAIREMDALPIAFVEFVRIGEESGTLGRMLAWLADFSDEQVGRDLELLATLAEPLVMGVMGTVVGFMLVATMLPLTQLLNAV